MRVTIKDVAKEAGVSVSTVSYALNRKGPPIKESHKRVLAAVEKLGYVPDATARSLVNSRTNNFAVIIGRNHESEEQDPYDIEIISAFSMELARAGSWMSLYLNDGRHPERLEELLLDAKTDGIAAVRTRLSENALNLIGRRRLPLITYECDLPAERCSGTVRTSPVTGIRQAVDHLVSLGHREIGLFDFTPKLSRLSVAADRLREHGLSPLPCLGAHPDRDSAYRELLGYIHSGAPLPTAFLAATDLMALGLIRALNEQGLRVPEDVSVIGYDDIQEARHAVPPLTTVSQHIPEAVRLICGMLTRLRDGEEPEEPETTVDTALVIRESTAAPWAAR